ncbi:MAG: hypothetical protein MJ016_04065 [Victivallaceae bacterium]|nr:hypothetical protein [Victivallaceae bacterium]
MKSLVRFFIGAALAVIGFAVLFLLLFVRPSQIEEIWQPDAEQQLALQSAAGKLGTAFYRGRREPRKKISIHFTAPECRAMLALLGNVANHFIGDQAGIASLENRAGDIAGCAEIKLPVGVIPVYFAANGVIRDKDLQVEINHVRAGLIPVPAVIVQKIADPFIADFKKRMEFRALVSGIGRFEFQKDGSLILEATPEACIQLMQQLF